MIYISIGKIEKTPMDVLRNYVSNSGRFQEVLEKIGYSKTNQRKTIERLIHICNENNIDISHLQDIPNLNFRKCKTCHKEKPIDEYYNIKGFYLKECKKCFCKKEKKKRDSCREEIVEYKKTLECKKCGEKRFYLLDFHHIDPSIKDFDISSKSHPSLETLKEELNKCIPLCTSCHREFHFLENSMGLTIEDYIDNDFPYNPEFY